MNPRLTEPVCDWMCKHAVLAASLGRLARPDLAGLPAEDRFFKHTYRSYSETMDKVILATGAVTNPFRSAATCSQKWSSPSGESHAGARLGGRAGHGAQDE